MSLFIPFLPSTFEEETLIESSSSIPMASTFGSTPHRCRFSSDFDAKVSSHSKQNSKSRSDGCLFTELLGILSWDCFDTPNSSIFFKNLKETKVLRNLFWCFDFLLNFERLDVSACCVFFLTEQLKNTSRNLLHNYYIFIFNYFLENFDLKKNCENVSSQNFSLIFQRSYSESDIRKIHNLRKFNHGE